MKVQALIKAVQDRLQEDTLEGLIILGWFDEAQNRLGIRTGGNFPRFLNPDGTQSTVDEPVFDDRYHELLIIYACARYRESDEAIGEAQYLDSIFETILSECVNTIQIIPMYQDTAYSQQFIATTGQTDFVITKPNFSPRYNELRIYVNNVLKSTPKDYRMDMNTIRITSGLVEGDRVSALWEDADLLNDPPQTWGAW